MAHDSKQRVEVLNQANFAEFISSRPYIIVHIGLYIDPLSFRSGIINHFSADLGDSVAFGCFDTSVLRYQLGHKNPYITLNNRPVNLLPPGYYLIVDSNPRAFHPGPGPVDPLQAKLDLLALGISGILSWASRSIEPLRKTAQAVDDQGAWPVISAFDEVLRTTSSRPPGATRDPAPPPRGQPTQPYDPYKTLGITPRASNDEVKQAFRKQSTLNHPDKVAHLAPAIQKFAAEEFKAIKAAFDHIMRMRRPK